MAESIVVTRLTRNLRYKLTYVRVFEGFLEKASNRDVVELLQGLIQAQQTAITALASYLRRIGVSAQDLELNENLIDQAAGRTDLRSQLQFIYDGLERAAGWYRTQLVDKQMTTDPELRAIFLELGELEAAKLWRTEAVMGVLKVPTKAKAREKEYEAEIAPEPQPAEEWRPRLIDDLGRPSWTGVQPARWSTPGKPRRKDRPKK